MIKKIFITLISVVGLGLSFSYGSFTGSGLLGSSSSYINKNLNFIPNPLNIDSNFPDLLKFKYGRTDNGFIYLGVDSVNSEFGTKFGTVLFNYNDPECNNTIPNYDFYNALSSGNFIPYTYSINVPGYGNTINYLSFCDKDGNCYYSCCGFNKSNNNVTFTCGHGSDSIVRVPVDITNAFPNSIFPVNNSPYIFDGTGYITFDSGGNVGEINLNLDNTIGYYEKRFGWDINMCYVGTNDISSVWGDSVEFKYGSGLTIFGLYHGLYNTFGSNSLQNVGSFINTWLLNYYGWFVTPNDERLYLARYNGPDTDITLIYTGFTFPFANNPIAIYFMSDLLASDYIAENSQGEEIAYYCDLKLNYDAYKDGTKSFEDLNSLLNPNIRKRIKGYNDLTLGSEDGYSTPSSSGTWSNNSGYSIPSDLSPTSLFKDLYNKIDNLSSGFSGLNTVGIIPWWILYPLIFLVLFRILRH